MCSYLPLSVEKLWELCLSDKEVDSSTPLGKYRLVSSEILGLQHTARYLCRRHIMKKPFINESGYSAVADNLCSIKEELGTREVMLGLLRNVPNVTFGELFEVLSPRLGYTVQYCTNAGIPCENIKRLHFGNFPNCFGYSPLDSSRGNTVSDVGISNGLTMVLMSGNQVASFILELGEKIPLNTMSESYSHERRMLHLLAGFQVNTGTAC